MPDLKVIPPILIFIVMDINGYQKHINKLTNKQSVTEPLGELEKGT